MDRGCGSKLVSYSRRVDSDLKARMSKPEFQKKLASVSFSQKIKILEKLRRRRLAIAASGLRPNKTDPHPK